MEDDDTPFFNALQELDLKLKMRNLRGAIETVGKAREAAMRMTDPEKRTDALNSLRELENGLTGNDSGPRSFVPGKNRFVQNDLVRNRYEQTNKPSSKNLDSEI